MGEVSNQLYSLPSEIVLDLTKFFDFLSPHFGG